MLVLLLLNESRRSIDIGFECLALDQLVLQHSCLGRVSPLPLQHQWQRRGIIMSEVADDGNVSPITASSRPNSTALDVLVVLSTHHDDDDDDDDDDDGNDDDDDGNGDGSDDDYLSLLLGLVVYPMYDRPLVLLLLVLLLVLV